MVLENSKLGPGDIGVLTGYFLLIILIGLCAVAAMVTPHRTLTVCSIYLSLSVAVMKADFVSLVRQLPPPFLLLGDLNGHSLLWGSKKSPMRGRLLEEVMWKSNQKTVAGYFLAGRSMWFLPVGASLFVSNIGTEHFIGLAGAGASNGIGGGAWEFAAAVFRLQRTVFACLLQALIVTQVLGWIFAPVYMACGAYTMPEFLSLRFGGQRLRVYFASLSLILYIFTKSSGDLYTGALFIQQSLNWDLYLSIIVMVLLTALLTITGGLKTVMYTDTLQATLMVGGSLYLMKIGFEEIGGFQGLLERYPKAVPTNVSAIVPNTTCHWPDRQAFRMLRDVDDDYMPWLGFFLGQIPGSIWYVCADQMIVQRILAAKSLSHAQGATLLNSALKLLPLYTMIFPGMISRILYPDEVACTNPDYCMEICQSRAGCSVVAYPKLILGLMPQGLRGLMMAMMIAALMSDLDSIFNSASTLFTMDVWRVFRKRASSTELMIVGRVFILVMVVVSIAWVPVIKETNRGQLFVYIQEVTNYFAPPFASVYLLAVLVPMINEQGAFWSLMSALVMGAVRLVVAFIYKAEGNCGESDEGMKVPAILAHFHYLYFAAFLTIITAVIAVVVSYFTERPDPARLSNTIYWNIRCEDSAPDQELGAPSQAPEAPPRSLSTISGPKVEERRSGEESREKLADLRQGRVEKGVLNVCLVLSLALAVAMYTFWSVYDFQEASYYPEGSAFLLPGDGVMNNTDSTA